MKAQNVLYLIMVGATVGAVVGATLISNPFGLVVVCLVSMLWLLPYIILDHMGFLADTIAAQVTMAIDEVKRELKSNGKAPEPSSALWNVIEADTDEGQNEGWPKAVSPKDSRPKGPEGVS